MVRQNLQSYRAIDGRGSCSYPPDGDLLNQTTPYSAVAVRPAKDVGTAADAEGGLPGTVWIVVAVVVIGVVGATSWFVADEGKATEGSTELEARSDARGRADWVGVRQEVGQAIVTMVFVVSFNFFLFRVMPGDPVGLLAKSEG